MKVYNSELFPALDSIVKAFSNNFGGDKKATEIASNLWFDAQITDNQASFAHSMASYLFDKNLSRADCLQVLHCTYGILSNEWEYRTDGDYCNTAYFISDYKGGVIAVGVGKKYNKMESIKYHKIAEWKEKFFNEMR